MPMYECDQCGACCQGNLIVEAYHIDLLREPRLREADTDCRDKSFNEALRYLQEDDRCLVLSAAKPCLFLRDCRCSIYSTRPNACVAMQAGDLQCQQVRAANGLPPLQPISNEEVPRDA
jgi:Fe-S-cluster containining protein